jgi:hypothetical protein
MERYVARSSWLVLQFAPAPATVLTRRFESQRVCEETRRIKGSPSASSVLRTEPIPPADPVIVNGVGVRRDVCWFEGVASLAFIAVRSTLTFAIVVGKSSSGAPSLKLRPPPCPATSPRACAASYSLASRMSAAAQRRLTYRLFPPDVMQYRPPRGPVQTDPLPQGQGPLATDRLRVVSTVRTRVLGLVPTTGAGASTATDGGASTAVTGGASTRAAQPPAIKVAKTMHTVRTFMGLSPVSLSGEICAATIALCLAVMWRRAMLAETAQSFQFLETIRSANDRTVRRPFSCRGFSCGLRGDDPICLRVRPNVRAAGW